jgi:hypothetical protein
MTVSYNDNIMTVSYNDNIMTVSYNDNIMTVSYNDNIMTVLQNVHLHQLDTSKPRDIYQFAHKFGESGQQLDVLVKYYFFGLSKIVSCVL